MATIPDGFIIPDFGDKPAAQDSKASSAEGKNYSEFSGPRKMSFICSKGNLDMAYPGLIMANAALGEGVEVNIFFTFWGLDIIHKKLNKKLRFTFAGNTAMHMPEMSYVKAGWENISFPQSMANLPGMTWFGTNYMKKAMDKLGIPPVDDMIDLLAEAGANMYACKLTVEMMKLIEADLKGIKGVISATDFIELSEGGQIVFI